MISFDWHQSLGKVLIDLELSLSNFGLALIGLDWFRYFWINQLTRLIYYYVTANVFVFLVKTYLLRKVNLHHLKER